MDNIDEFIKDDYVELKDPEIGIKTDKAIQISGIWIPLSQMRTDAENLFLRDWLYNKHFGI